jgi:hypothetical protein
MLKHLLVCCIAIGLFTSISAQDIYKPDKRLYDCFTAEELSQMEASKSELIPYYNYYLDHSYYVVTLKSAEKPITGRDIHQVNSAVSQTSQKFNEKTYSKETFNPLKYNFNLELHNSVTYLWKEAGIAIIFRPNYVISSDFKNYFEKLKN